MLGQVFCKVPDLVSCSLLFLLSVIMFNCDLQFVFSEEGCILVAVNICLNVQLAMSNMHAAKLAFLCDYQSFRINSTGK